MIDDLKTMISRRGGLAKPNRFEVIFSLPDKLTSDDRGRDLTLLCESATLPGKIITTTEWAVYGHTIKVPTSFIQEDVACVFNVTSDFYVKDIFDRWQNLVIDNNTYNINYDDVFKKDIILRQLGEDNRILYEMKLKGAYPINVGTLVLDNNSESNVQKLPVSFAYNDFEQKRTYR